MRVYIRKCQECGCEQMSKDPKTYKGNNEAWRDVKCKRCGSEALDYGSYRSPEAEEQP